MCNWVQAYSMQTRDFAAIVETFRSVFPYVSMWESVPGGDYFLIGAEQPLRFSYEQLRERLQSRGLQADFTRIGVLDAENLLCSFVMQGAQLEAFAQQAPVNTDDNAILEFSAPKGLYQGLVGQGEIFQLKHLAPFRQADLSFLDEPAGEELQAAWQARQEALSAQLEAGRKQYAAALVHLERARQLRPQDMELRRVLPEVGEKMAEELVGRQDFQQALALYQQILEVVPDEAMAHYQMGKLHEQLRQDEAARMAFAKAIELAPRFMPVYIHLAAACGRSGLLELPASPVIQTGALDGLRDTLRILADQVSRLS